MSTDLDQRLRHDLHAAAKEVATSRDAPDGLLRELRRRRQDHRRRSAGLIGLCAVGGVALVVATAVSLGDGRRTVAPSTSPSLLGEPQAVSEAPLSPRESHTAAWTGDEMIIWGGQAGSDAQAETFGDGAAFDPASGTWRTIAPAPIGPRARHSAVWTGNEMLVMGGTERAFGSGDSLQAAAYDPQTDTWRRIASLPSARTDATALLVDGRVVLAGGATPPSGPRASSLLVYDIAADRWSEIAVGAPVFDAVATEDGSVTVVTMRPDMTGIPQVIDVDLDTGVTSHRPDLPVSGDVIATGLAIDGSDVVAAVTEDQTTTVYRSEGPDSWQELAELSADDFTPGTRREDAAPGFTDVIDGWLVARGPRTVNALDLHSDDARTTQLQLDQVCGRQESTLIAEEHLISWGGGRCDSSSASESNAGVALQLNVR
jgi:hypothetical protein